MKVIDTLDDLILQLLLFFFRLFLYTGMPQSGETALFLAAYAGQKDVVSTLLSSKASLSAGDKVSCVHKNIFFLYRHRLLMPGIQTLAWCGAWVLSADALSLVFHGYT